MRAHWNGRSQKPRHGRNGGPFQYKTRSGMIGGERREQLAVTLLLLLGNGDGDAHAAPRFDAFDEAIHFDGLFEAEARREAGAYPKRVKGFDEHAIGADIARAAADESRAPFDLEFGVKRIARRPAALKPSRIVPVAHRPR